jgi:hypothetical protein
MSKLVEIVQKIGILSPTVLAEMKGWGLPLDEVVVEELAPSPTPESISRAIADAIESEGYVLTRETDLEAIPQYLQSMQSAMLHVVIADGETAEFEVQVGQDKAGDWILPWRSDSITDLLTNGETYLRVKGQRVYFNQARELFYGDRKAFILCTPSTLENADGNDR